MASPTRWTWVWVNSESWWTGRPGVLQFMGSQRVGHDWATELNWTEPYKHVMLLMCIFPTPYISYPAVPLFCSWKLEPFNPPHLLLLTSPSPTLWQPPVCFLYLWLWFCFVMFVHLFCFSDSTYKWNYTVFVFLCLTYFISVNALWVHPCCHKWQDFIFFMINIPLYGCSVLSSYPFIYWWVLKLFL